jgi:hypothetical protein
MSPLQASRPGLVLTSAAAPTERATLVVAPPTHIERIGLARIDRWLLDERGAIRRTPAQRDTCQRDQPRSGHHAALWEARAGCSPFEGSRNTNSKSDSSRAIRNAAGDSRAGSTGMLAAYEEGPIKERSIGRSNGDCGGFLALDFP